ncbi:MAG: alpha/beta hydrolase [Pseudomonadota bacterium]
MESNATYYTSEDGLSLYYRDFGTGDSATPIICLPGLTRNSRDFEDFAQRLESRRRVLTPDLRGRGHSDYDPEWRNYHPLTYVNDTWRLLDTLGIERVIVMGTSLGGLCGMAMSMQDNARIAGLIMNDIGPEIAPEGIRRVQEYTGRLPPVADWDGAVRQTREVYGAWLPGLSDEQWREMARRAYREHDGVPRLDFDPNVGRAVREVGPQKGDPWQFFATLRDTPVTLLWGVDSDILSKDICDKMLAAKPDLKVVPVANRGHVPLLDEPECIEAIDAMLEAVP